MSSFGKFIFGAALGGAIGAFVAMLFAPRSGEDTRKKIREDMERRYEQSVETVRENLQDVRDNVQEKVEVMRGRAGEVGHQIRESAETLKDKAREISEELEETGRQAFARMTEKNP